MTDSKLALIKERVQMYVDHDAAADIGALLDEVGRLHAFLRDDLDRHLEQVCHHDNHLAAIDEAAVRERFAKVLPDALIYKQGSRSG